MKVISSQVAGALENKFKYNGKEQQHGEFSDGGGLELYDYGARMQDPQLGRFNQIDPMAGNREWITPFNYVQNNPISRVDPNGTFDDYFIRKDGDIVVKKTDDSFDRFYIEKSQRTEGDMVIRSYSLASKLEKNDQGLVNFPGSGEGFSRYGGVQPEAQLSGVDKNGAPYTENIGSGDHWLQPKAAAALFGTINASMGNGLKNLALGDMSTSSGSDPATAATTPGGKDFHHESHGHLGRGEGINVDFRYVGADGKSFQSNNAFGSDNYNSSINNSLYSTANKFGFTRNGQGTNGTIPGASKWPGHNNHGHFGLNPDSSNFKTYEPYK